MDEKVIIRKAKLNDFQGVHKLIMQVHKLHVSKRNDIYKDIDPMLPLTFHYPLLRFFKASIKSYDKRLSEYN